MTKKFLYSLLAILFTSSLLWGATQTLNTLPVSNASFMATLQAFLNNENANRFHLKYAGFIFSGGTASTSANLTHTISECIGMPNGYYVDKSSISHTYTASKRTFVFLDYDDSRTITIPGASVTRSTNLVFAELPSSTVEIQAPSGTISLMYVDTSSVAITAVTDLRSGGNIAIDCYASLSDADTKAPTNSSLVINTRQVLSSDTTITHSIIVEKGGQFISNGYNLTLNGSFSSGLFQVFSGFSSNTVTFGSSALISPPIPIWFGGGSSGATAANSTNIIQTLTANSATPDVSTLMPVYKTNNSAPTTITNFSNGVKGQSFILLIGDANTTISFTGSNIKGHGGVDWTPTVIDSSICTYDGTVWRVSAPFFSYPGVGLPISTGIGWGTSIAETDGDIIYGSSGSWVKGTTLPNGITATTQAAKDNSTKVATTAYADSAGIGVNRLINGDMRIDQRNSGSSQTISAGAALAYTVDRWYAYATTSSSANVTGQQIAGSGSTQYRYRFTGASNITKIAFAQRIEAANSYDLNNQTATLSVDLANSLLTTVTWKAYYANTTDNFGTIASPTKTQIATGTWSVNSTISSYNTQIAIPSAATTGIEIELSVGSQVSGTWTIGNVKLELGGSATNFVNDDINTALVKCQRYFYVLVPYGPVIGCYLSYNTTAYAPWSFPVQMRAAPSLTKIGVGWGYNGNVLANDIGDITCQGFNIWANPVTDGYVTTYISAGSARFSAEL